VRIICSLTGFTNNDLVPLTVYLQDSVTMEVDEAEEDDSSGHKIATLLDTGALGIDGNYISGPIANKIDKNRLNRRVGTDLTVCGGINGECLNTNNYMVLKVKLKQNVFITLKFYILQESPIDLIIGKHAIIQYNLLSMFPEHFGLVPVIDTESHTQCTECTQFGSHTQCTECGVVQTVPQHQSPEPPSPATLVNNISQLDQRTGQWLLNVLADHSATSYSSVTPAIPQGISLDIMDVCPEPSDDAEPDDYNSDADDVAINTHASSCFLASLFVPVGSSLPEQLALEALAQGVFRKRNSHPVEQRQLNGIGSKTWPVYGEPNAENLDTNGRISSGPEILTVAEARRKEVLPTTSCGGDNVDYPDVSLTDLSVPFQNRPEDNVKKFSKTQYKGSVTLNTKNINIREFIKDLMSLGKIKPSIETYHTHNANDYRYVNNGSELQFWPSPNMCHRFERPVANFSRDKSQGQ